MKKIISLFATASTLVATSASAGGPVVVIDDGQPAVVTAGPSSSVKPGVVIGVIAGAVILCAILCGGGSDGTDTIPGGEG
jgi:hypothetical protein